MRIEISDKCIRCGRCVRVCPFEILEQEKPGMPVTVQRPDRCIGCGHCVAVCPASAIDHELFPAGTIHPLDRAALPSADAVELLIRARRSNRALTDMPVPEEALRRIVAAADCAPTASNARELGYTLVTDPAKLRAVTEFTLGVFDRTARLLSYPLMRPFVRFLMPDAARYLPAFRRMKQQYAEGRDPILRGATAVLFIHAPLKSRFAVEDSNLACQNASLMAEALGVSQIYMGFVLVAGRRQKGALEQLLGLDGRRVCAVLALGMPAFRFANTFERKASPVTRL